jgi:hypothetical protein
MGAVAVAKKLNTTKEREKMEVLTPRAACV